MSLREADRDRRMFLAFLGQAAKRFGWSVTAYVLMTNHFHLDSDRGAEPVVGHAVAERQLRRLVQSSP